MNAKQSTLLAYHIIMSLSRATGLSYTHFQNCPWKCPAMKLPILVWGLVITSSTLIGTAHCLTSNYTDKIICKTLNIGRFPDNYADFAKAYWYIYTVAFPRSIWEGVKAGAYAAVYPGIWMYQCVKRMLTLPKDE